MIKTQRDFIFITTDRPYDELNKLYKLSSAQQCDECDGQQQKDKPYTFSSAQQCDECDGQQQKDKPYTFSSAQQCDECDGQQQKDNNFPEWLMKEIERKARSTVRKVVVVH